MKKSRRGMGLGLLSGLVLGFLLPGAADAADAQMTRGQYIATIMDCAGCHTGGVFLGKPDPARYLAGSEVGFAVPGLGIFYPPNLTPDKETGLGGWSAADITKALRTGARPDGRELAPAMPWRSYAALNDADMRSLVSYLKSLKPVSNKVPGPVGPTEKAPGPYLSVVMP